MALYSFLSMGLYTYEIMFSLWIFFFITLIGPSRLLYTYSLLFIYQGIDFSSITFSSLGQMVFLMFPKKKKNYNRNKLSLEFFDLSPNKKKKKK